MAARQHVKVVIGAGVVALTTAYELCKDGHEVTVVERHDGAEESSFGNAGPRARGAARRTRHGPVHGGTHGPRGDGVAGSLDVPVMGSFNLPDDNAVARISEASIEDALVELASDPAVDAAFVACTSLRVCGIVERAEERVGKPITSSNHALAWHCLRLAGIRDEIDGLGRLFRTQLPG